MTPAERLDGVTQRWAGRAQFVILDTAFGAGAQFLATWRAWQADPQRPRRLYYLALDAAPAAVAAMPAALQAQWPPELRGVHRMVFEQGGVTLDLMTGDADAALAHIAARVDAFYVGPTPRSASALARLAQAGATLVGASAALRQPLTNAGFVCAASEHPLRAIFTARSTRVARATEPVAHAARHAIVIGAGLAGAAACECLIQRGWRVTLIERHAQPAQEASGNLTGIFMPQLSRDDNPASRLSRAAYLFALRHWQRLGGVGVAFAGARCGVLQLARDAAHAALQRQIAASANYPLDFARWLEAPAASQLLKAATPDGGWFFEQGGWAHPAALCAAMLSVCGAQLERRFSSSAMTLVRVDGQWQVCDASGALIAAAPTVILANGNGATSIAQAAGLPLVAVRGQVSHLAQDSLPSLPLVVCREAYMTPASNGIVCVGASYDADSERTLRATSQLENLTKITSILDLELTPALRALPLAGRTGFRCVAPDRLPLVGALPNLTASAGMAGGAGLREVPRWPGLFGLLGYASRGLIWAPLAAELLAAQLDGAPLPLEASLAAALDPARFWLKEQRRQ